MSFSSEELRNTLINAHEKGFTGYISVTSKEGIKRVYGTLTLSEGELIAAQYANQKGQGALKAMQQLNQPKVSVAKSVINAHRHKDLPAMTSIFQTTSGHKKQTQHPTSSKKPKPFVTSVTQTKRENRFTIFPKVLIVIFCVALIPMAGLWYTSYVKAQQDWEATVNNNLTAAANIVEAKVSDWADMNLRFLRHSASLEDIISMDPELQFPILTSLTNTYEWMGSSITVDLNGNNIANSDGDPVPVSFADRAWFQSVLSGNPWGQDVVISRVTNLPIFVMAVPIVQEGSTIGIQAMGLAIERISKAVTDINVGETGLAFLVDQQGRVIAHGQPELVSEDLQDFSKHPALLGNINQEQVVFQDDNGVRKVAFPKVIPEWGLTLVIEQDYNDAFAPLISARNNALSIFALTIFLVFVVAYLFARRLVKPIEHLTKAADAMSRGQLNSPIRGIHRGDEIGSLARAVDRMGMSIKVMFRQIQSQQDNWKS